MFLVDEFFIQSERRTAIAIRLSCFIRSALYDRVYMKSEFLLFYNEVVSVYKLSISYKSYCEVSAL